ncbi:MAG TPA: SRPBCC family protein [Rhizomicrobium sp.]|nr:SRPBCC family protein [Rhizomicrobium sp.]
MSELTRESTVYAIYIATTVEKCWEALTSSAFTTRYFFGRSVESDWKEGSPWLLRMPDGRVDVAGQVREAKRPHRLVLTWTVEWMEPKPPECLVTYEIEDTGNGVVRLTMTEDHPTPIPRAWLEGGRKGWPMILSGLKSLLETGKPLGLPTPMPPKEISQ